MHIYKAIAKHYFQKHWYVHTWTSFCPRHSYLLHSYEFIFNMFVLSCNHCLAILPHVYLLWLFALTSFHIRSFIFFQYIWMFGTNSTSYSYNLCHFYTIYTFNINIKYILTQKFLLSTLYSHLHSLPIPPTFAHKIRHTLIFYDMLIFHILPSSNINFTPQTNPHIKTHNGLIRSKLHPFRVIITQ